MHASLTSVKPVPCNKLGGNFLLQRKQDCCSSTASLLGICQKYAKPTLQTKLTIGEPDDTYEQEADQIAQVVLRSSLSEMGVKIPAISPIMPKTHALDGSECNVPAIVDEVLFSAGEPLGASTRSFFEPRFGHNFGDVRVHTDTQAGESARLIGARAYTAGRKIVFGVGEYSPSTVEGKRLLAHELTHVVQQNSGALGPGPKQNIREAKNASQPRLSQGSGAGFLESPGHDFSKTTQSVRDGSTPLTVQRDLLAYKTEHTEYLPSAPESPSVTYEIYTSDALDIQNALRSLITANQISLREADDRMFFFNRGATRSEIVFALKAAGYAKAHEMADALLDEHNVSLYSRERVTRMSSLFTTTLGRRADLIEPQSERPLTGVERAEARLVFGNSLDYERIRLAEDPILSVGGYGRTTPWTINFPVGSFGSTNFMPWLIHELTHSWQYQHGISLFTTIYHAILSSYDYGYDAGLRAARSAGRGFTSFNTEQQGDILMDYYNRLKSGLDVTTWQPFVDDVVHSQAPGDFPTPSSRQRAG